VYVCVCVVLVVESLLFCEYIGFYMHNMFSQRAYLR